jgi:hypothetical protein
VKKLKRACFLLLAAFVVVTVIVAAVTARFLANVPFVAVGGPVVLGLGFFGALFWTIARLRELRYLLEIGEARICLLAPNGADIADTASGSLTFRKINYTRRGRYGTAWLRPGFRLRHPGGDHLVGTLLPEPPWEGVGHDPAMPEFELRRPEFAALRTRVSN